MRSGKDWCNVGRNSPKSQVYPVWSNFHWNIMVICSRFRDPVCPLLHSISHLPLARIPQFTTFLVNGLLAQKGRLILLTIFGVLKFCYCAFLFWPLKEERLHRKLNFFSIYKRIRVVFSSILNLYDLKVFELGFWKNLKKLVICCVLKLQSEKMQSIHIIS